MPRKFYWKVPAVFQSDNLKKKKTDSDVVS